MGRKKATRLETTAPAIAGWRWGGGEEVEEITWLWEPWLPSSALSLVCGEPQMGKSTLLAHLAAGVTLRLAEGKGASQVRPSVLWVHGEESWGMAALPRLAAAAADCSRVLHPERLEDASRRVTVGTLAAEMPEMIALGVRLVVIDPLAALCEEGADWTSEGSARSVLDTLQALAGQWKIPVLATRNWNKRKQGSRLDRISGSHAFRDVPRAILSCARDPLQSDRFVLCLDKWSYGPGTVPLCYDLDRDAKTGVPVWRQLGECRLEADDLDDERLRGGERAQWRAAHTLLRAMIPPEGIEAKKLHAEAEICGIKRTTLWRAAVELGVVMVRSGFGAAGHSQWFPPAKGWPDGLETHEIRGREIGGGVRAGGSGTAGTDGRA
jgi:hypothetical protein